MTHLEIPGEAPILGHIPQCLCPSPAQPTANSPGVCMLRAGRGDGGGCKGAGLVLYEAGSEATFDGGTFLWVRIARQLPRID